MAQPIQKISVGGIQVAIWENPGKEGASYYSVSLDKRYKDANNQWKSSSSLKTTDLPKAILALQKAYEFLMLKEAAHENALELEPAFA